jgi:hypothetical protein
MTKQNSRNAATTVATAISTLFGSGPGSVGLGSGTVVEVTERRPPPSLTADVVIGGGVVKTVASLMELFKSGTNGPTPTPAPGSVDSDTFRVS